MTIHKIKVQTTRLICLHWISWHSCGEKVVDLINIITLLKFWTLKWIHEC